MISQVLETFYEWIGPGDFSLDRSWRLLMNTRVLETSPTPESWRGRLAGRDVITRED